MDKDRLDGIGHQIKGALKEGLGKVIGDAKLTADGIAERTDGEVQVIASEGPHQVLGIDTDRIAGVGHQLKGAVKEGVGKLFGDAGLADNGVAERAAGKVQNAAGSARDAALKP